MSYVFSILALVGSFAIGALIGFCVGYGAGVTDSPPEHWS